MSDSHELKPSQRMGRIEADTGKPLDAAQAAQTGQTVFRAAERSAEFFDHLRAHYRETRRTPVEIPADIRVMYRNGEVYDAGHATIINISPSGALLSKIKLPKKTLPLDPFRFEIVMKGGDYEGIGVEATPIRFEHDVAGIGVRFEEIFVAVDEA